MGRAFSLCSAIVFCGLVASPAVHADTPVLATTFEKDAGDWSVLNIASGQAPTAAKISVTHNAAHIKEGKGSLQFDYVVKKGEPNLLYLPAGPGTITKANSIHFWINADHPTSFMLVVSEKDAGRYQTTFTASGTGWQEVSIAFSELVLNEDEGSPKDPDGKLDADQIEGIGLIDTECYLAQMIGDTPAPFNIAAGAHTLYISPFAFNSLELAPAAVSPTGGKLLTSLIRPQVDWMVVGGMSVQKVVGAPMVGAAIQASYKQTKGKIFGLLKSVKSGSLTGTKQISFTAASKNPVTLLVQVEESDGGKYNTTVMIAGGSMAKEYTLKLSEFVAGQDSKDANSTLDTPLINKVLFADVSGMGDVDEKDNSLWINHLQTTNK